ncbi:hypothetical protein BMS3Bbin15_00440 [archaeon BMS3Bbin15]|nr:hypothetical protein BMS3Bbin15_00440 [archaeon BMS3Bbin15]
MHSLLVYNNTLNKFCIFYTAAFLLLYFDVVHVNYNLSIFFFGNSLHCFHNKFREVIFCFFCSFTCHSHNCNIFQRINIYNRNFMGHIIKYFLCLFCSQTISTCYYCWMHVLIEKVLCTFQKLSGYNHGSCCTVTNLIFLSLGNINHHLAHRMFNIHLFEYCGTIVCYNYISYAIHKHLVHSSWTQSCL